MDHNHKTGAFRGYLCPGCNKALGMMRDSRDILLKAVCYLDTDDAPDTATEGEGTQ